MADQDVYETFKALPRDRQESLLQKMSPEQKANLRKGIEAKKSASAGPAPTKTATPAAPQEGMMEKAGKAAVGVMSGIGGAAMQGVNTVTGLANKALPSSAQIPQIPKEYTEERNTAEKIGGGVENLMEYAAGDKAITALGQALEVKNVAAVANIVRKFPFLSRIAEAGMRSFVLGSGQSALHGESDAMSSGKSTAIVGMLGEGAGSALSKMGGKSLGKAYDAVNNLIGLKTTDLPKWERSNIGKIEEVGKAVLDNVPLKGGLEDIHMGIQKASQNVLAETNYLVSNSVGGRAVPYHFMLDNIKDTLIQKLYRTGLPGTQDMVRAVEANYGEMKKLITNPYLSPQQALAIRREVGKRINSGLLGKKATGVEKEFLEDVYHGLNDGIEGALQPHDGAQFRKLNRVQNRLRVASDASEDKIRANAMNEAKVGAASKLARAVIGGGVGAAAGAYTGSKFGETGEGAAVGALAGAGLGGSAHKITLPKADVAIQAAKAKFGPTLAKAARKSPALARAIESSNAAHFRTGMDISGGGSGSISQQQ